MAADREQKDLIPDASSTSASAPGEVLRRHREAQGYEPGDVAKRLHLPVRMVEALEEDRYQDLPEPPYVQGYIGAYARFLDLDAAPLIATYQERTHPQDPAIFSSRVPSGVPTQRIVFVWGSVAVAGLLVALLVFWWLSERPEDTAAREEALQERAEVQPRASGAVSTQAGADLARTSTAPEPVSMAPIPVTRSPEGARRAQAEDAPAPEPAVQAPVSSPSPPAASVGGLSTAQAVTADAGGDSERPSAPGRHRLQLAFGGQSWTEIYDSDDNRLLFDLVKAGERRTVEGKAPFRIVLGNARVVRVELDGRPVEVTPDSLRGSTARFTVEAPDSP